MMMEDSLMMEDSDDGGSGWMEDSDDGEFLD